MHTRLLWRRSATAIGLYGSVALGVIGTLVAARELGPHGLGLYSLALSGAGFFQVLLDLTVEEAMVKFGFRYTTAERWGRLRRLYRRALVLKTAGAVFAAAALAIAAPFADGIFGTHGLRNPMLLAALLPIAYLPEAPSGAALVLTGRYDVRAAFVFLTQALRLAGLVVGAHYGIEQALLGLVAGQVAGSAAVGAAALAAFRRFPAAAPEALGDDRAEIVRFVIQSSIGVGGRFPANSGRAAPPRDGLDARPGRLLPCRPGAADRPDRADRAGAADPPHRADARLGGRSLGEGLCRPAALQRRRDRR